MCRAWVLPMTDTLDLQEAIQTAWDLKASLELCTTAGDELAEVELEGQVARHPWLGQATLGSGDDD